jgi:hypothetical protein
MHFNDRVAVLFILIFRVLSSVRTNCTCTPVLYRFSEHCSPHGMSQCIQAPCTTKLPFPVERSGAVSGSDGFFDRMLVGCSQSACFGSGQN